MTKEDVFYISNEIEFNRISLEIFRYQYRENPIYQSYVDLIQTDVNRIKSYKDIPFLPIQFFKNHIISTNKNDTPQIVFTSSGSTGIETSKHLVFDLSWYETSFNLAFKQFYGKVEDYTILALLPSYLERSGSSLIYMIDTLIKASKQPDSDYFLYNHSELYKLLIQLKSNKKKTLLIGVTYALLDFINEYKITFPELIVMETGGMKGRRKEMVREEVHDILCKGFGVSHIHSEYGMTELLSQGYSQGQGIFQTPPWMKILVRDTNDPFNLLDHNKTGAINVIDLANYHSCSFIATQDLGKSHSSDTFEVLGRFDNAEIRGCNLLIQ